MKFEEINLNDNILDALYDMNFVECTPVQEKCIPEILKGRDLMGVAQTGTGKTAAYLLPILSLLDDGKYPKDVVNCIIMSPTRELAQQIDQAMQGFAYHLPEVSSVAVYGGNDGNRYDQELKSMRLGADVIIATPGRLISHMTMGNIDLSKVSFFVLDEADRMLDMGFSEDIMKIASQLPKSCHTIMFSATMPDEIEKMAQKLLKDPVLVKLAVSKPAEKIKQSAYICYTTQKIQIIKSIFKAGDLKRVIIFSGSKQKVKQINQALSQLHINSGEMHSDLDQSQRDEMMYKFKSGQIDVLVATDIVARGIDIDDIAMVINYDVPRDSEDYVHRIGRTARADRDGVAITLVNEDDMYAFHQIEKFLNKDIEKNPLPVGMDEGPEYVVSKNPKRSSAKKRRKDDRDVTSHKRTKQRTRNRSDRTARGDRARSETDIISKDNLQDANQQPRVNNRDDGKSHPNDNANRNDETKRSGKRRADNKNARGQQKRTRDNTAPRSSVDTNDEAPDRKRNNRQRRNNRNNNGVPDEKKKNQRRNDKSRRTNRGSKNLSTAASDVSAKETGLKAILKKPLKWLKGLGK
ncbi:DEAD/DEAH box helicase [Hallella colorans]|uniref:DEAD/DEAH box helicase n=1 Tax=Hallella colorans TaxID=1703337 RepID=UPI0023F2ECB4|nr:DEAD/DEAH box helicase [Hallella colorans]